MGEAEIIIDGDNSEEITYEGEKGKDYEGWGEYLDAIQSGDEEVQEETRKPAVRKDYEFDVDNALNEIDLTFPDYTPSVQAFEFFNIIRIVLGEDPEVQSSIMHYFLIDLAFGNITADMFPFSKTTRGKIRVNRKKLAIIASRRSAKALALGSAIITPTGKVTMRNVLVGDKVLDRNGVVCNVIAKSEVFLKEVYKITLADGRELKMSGDHDNIVWKRKRRLEKGVSRCKTNRPAGMEELVMTAKELYDDGVTTKRAKRVDCSVEQESKYYIPLANIIANEPQYEKKEFPIDAYTTGVILGDGSIDKPTGYTRVTTHIDDLPNYVEHIPYEFGKLTKKYTGGKLGNSVVFGLLGLGPLVKEYIGLDRSYTKRVPVELLTGSAHQRMEVLKGLMDTDGTVYKTGYCSYTSVSQGLAEDVQDLVQSLGGIAFIHESKTDSPFGKAWSTRIKINRPIFKLKRKLSRQTVLTKDMKVGIIKIEKIPMEPTQCIAVDSPTKSFLTDGYTVTHNSTILTAYLPIYVAITGKIPNFGDVMFWVSFGDAQHAGAKVQANTIRDICIDSIYCKGYFEKMRFTDEECEFVRRGTGKEAKRSFMFKVKGASGSSVRGIRYRAKRIDVLTFDDIIKSEADARSPVIMRKLNSMIYSDAESAMNRNGLLILINTPFTKKDPIYSALENGVWTPMCVPMCEKISATTTKEQFIGSWPQMNDYEWAMERYLDAKYGNTLREFNQELMLRIASEEDKMIKKDDIQWYSKRNILGSIDSYKVFATTDYTASNTKKGDLSGTALWAMNSIGDLFLLELSLKVDGIEEQFNHIFNMVQVYTAKYGVPYIEVGIEINGQQQLNLPSLKNQMMTRNVYFSFARQLGQADGREGISRSGGNKHDHFMRVHPMFQGKKIYFPEELKDTPDMKELLEELNGITYTALTSRKDDGIDLVSMIGLMAIQRPSEDSGFSDDRTEGGNSRFYFDEYEEDTSNRSSTIF